MVDSVKNLMSIKASELGNQVMNIDAIRHIVLSYFGVAGLKEHKEKMAEIVDSINIINWVKANWLDVSFDDDEILEKTQYKLSMGGEIGLIKKSCRRFPPLARHLSKATRKTIYDDYKAFGKLKSQINRQFEKEVCYQIYLEGGTKMYT